MADRWECRLACGCKALVQTSSGLDRSVVLLLAVRCDRHGGNQEQVVDAWPLPTAER